MISLLAIAGLTVVVILVSCWRALRHRQNFNERFPPITDEEFLARCPPGTRRHVALGVRRIVAEKLGVEYARIYPESSFINDLGAD